MLVVLSNNVLDSTKTLADLLLLLHGIWILMTMTHIGLSVVPSKLRPPSTWSRPNVSRSVLIVHFSYGSGLFWKISLLLIVMSSSALHPVCMSQAEPPSSEPDEVDEELLAAVRACTMQAHVEGADDDMFAIRRSGVPLAPALEAAPQVSFVLVVHMFQQLLYDAL